MNKLLMVGLVAVASCYAQSATFAQEQTQFKKENFSYNEWTKGKFSEVVTVTNPGKFIFLAGIGPEREGDGKIVEAISSANAIMLTVRSRNFSHFKARR